MTTDTVRKESAYELELSSGTIRIGAMAKGSGMIHPNMATTLAYVTTDAKCDSADLQKMLHNAIDKSFNMCTVDGDTSTNDTMILLANGASGVEVKTEEDKAALAGLIEHLHRHGPPHRLRRRGRDPSDRRRVLRPAHRA